MNSTVINLTLSTPSGVVYTCSANSVLAPCTSGDIEIMPGHTQAYGYIDYGVITINRGKKDYWLVCDGLMEIANGLSITISCGSAANIAELSLEELRAMIASGPEDRRVVNESLLEIKKICEK